MAARISSRVAPSRPSGPRCGPPLHRSGSPGPYPPLRSTRGASASPGGSCIPAVASDAVCDVGDLADPVEQLRRRGVGPGRWAGPSNHPRRPGARGDGRRSAPCSPVPAPERRQGRGPLGSRGRQSGGGRDSGDVHFFPPVIGPATSRDRPVLVTRYTGDATERGHESTNTWFCGSFRGLRADLIRIPVSQMSGRSGRGLRAGRTRENAYGPSGPERYRAGLRRMGALALEGDETMTGRRGAALMAAVLILWTLAVVAVATSQLGHTLRESRGSRSGTRAALPPPPSSWTRPTWTRPFSVRS